MYSAKHKTYIKVHKSLDIYAEFEKLSFKISTTYFQILINIKSKNVW